MTARHRLLLQQHLLPFARLIANMFRSHSGAHTARFGCKTSLLADAAMRQMAHATPPPAHCVDSVSRARDHVTMIFACSITDAGTLTSPAI